MKDRPILFSAPMVRALLDGSKTQTRRVVKAEVPAGIVDFCAYHHPKPGHWLYGWDEADKSLLEFAMRSPYGGPGDRLWVREAWGYFDPDGTGEDYDRDHNEEGKSGPCTAYHADMLQEGSPLRDFWRRRIAYKATFAEQKYGMGPVGPSRWRPSIHMPRWASRIPLEIVSVRVERLQDISEADSKAEGWTPRADITDAEVHRDAARDWYMDLWESLNGIGSWVLNPYVWCVEFRRLP